MKPIKVWRFEDAPEKYRRLSAHGGDEDWVALLPAGVSPSSVWWAREGTPFGMCDVFAYPLANNQIVLIGAHA